MSTENNTIEGNKSLTVEEYEAKYKPLLNQALDLLNTHSDIPEEVVQSDVISAVITMGNELSATVNGRVPEIVKLQEEIAKKNKQISKLQETNQQLFLKVGNYQDPSKKTDDPDDRPKKSFSEIKAMIENM